MRQAALTQLKIACEYRWVESDRWKSAEVVQELEKAEVRKYLFPALVRCSNENRFLKLYRAIIKNIIIHDYQQWMPTDQVVSSLLNDPVHIVQTLHFIMGIVEGFELQMDESRNTLSKVPSPTNLVHE